MAKIKVWIDSGANIHSKAERIVDLEDWGITLQEWEELDQEEKFNNVLNEFQSFDWGYEEFDE